MSAENGHSQSNAEKSTAMPHADMVAAFSDLYEALVVRAEELEIRRRIWRKVIWGAVFMIPGLLIAWIGSENAGFPLIAIGFLLLRSAAIKHHNLQLALRQYNKERDLKKKMLSGW